MLGVATRKSWQHMTKNHQDLCNVDHASMAARCGILWGKELRAALEVQKHRDGQTDLTMALDTPSVTTKSFLNLNSVMELAP